MSAGQWDAGMGKRIRGTCGDTPQILGNIGVPDIRDPKKIKDKYMRNNGESQTSTMKACNKNSHSL
jgi:hypothetical protein